jgi:ribosomal protein S18 acetylase RimI-like enzyme
MTHPLDRAAWSALTSRQAHLALGDDRARRLDPAYGLFAAAADRAPQNLAALVALIRATGPAAFFEADPPTEIPGLSITPGAPISQWWAEAPAYALSDFEVVELGDADAGEMLALARLTEPGPFFARTHQLGGFVGVREAGRLVAMAGERLKLTGYTEVSAVCTHPEHRGHGYAAGLMSVVMRRIAARGEIPFLHAYDHNTGALALYARLGYRKRRSVVVSFVEAA